MSCSQQQVHEDAEDSTSLSEGLTSSSLILICMMMISDHIHSYSEMPASISSFGRQGHIQTELTAEDEASGAQIRDPGSSSQSVCGRESDRLDQNPSL